MNTVPKTDRLLSKNFKHILMDKLFLDLKRVLNGWNLN